MILKNNKKKKEFLILLKKIKFYKNTIKMGKFLSKFFYIFGKKFSSRKI